MECARGDVGRWDAIHGAGDGVPSNFRYTRFIDEIVIFGNLRKYWYSRDLLFNPQPIYQRNKFFEFPLLERETYQ